MSYIVIQNLFTKHLSIMKHFFIIGVVVLVALIIHELIVKKGLQKVGLGSSFEEGYDSSFERISA